MIPPDIWANSISFDHWLAKTIRKRELPKADRRVLLGCSRLVKQNKNLSAEQEETCRRIARRLG